jgi:hypothetical protein
LLAFNEKSVATTVENQCLVVLEPYFLAQCFQQLTGGSFGLRGAIPTQELLFGIAACGFAGRIS